ncbi:MAG: hypothetical protein J6L96_02705 [Clostridia bacterium]|nr:hypothetical protein [Clostridia bacterium]
MYTRNYGKQRRYSPPPGYAGSTISGDGQVKHHLPADEVKRLAKEVADVDDFPRESYAKPSESNCAEEKTAVDIVAKKDKDNSSLHELLKSLRGRFGSEELIILTVMLLIAQDGIGAEVLILALILIAG